MGKQAAAIGARIRKQVADAAKMLALQIDRELRRLTPIDTGHARRNWIPSVGSPSSTVASDNAAHDQGVIEVLSYKLSDGTLWVANNVGYVIYLNYGTSAQRAAGWIELAIDIAMQKVQAKLEKAGRGGELDVGRMRAEWQSLAGGDAAENLASAYSPFGGDE